MIEKKVISTLVKPLVESGLYKNETIALKDIIVDFIERKIDFYDKTIRQMQDKFDGDFEKFNKSLKGKATMEEEDDWMEWKSSILMKESWQKSLKNILKNAA